MPKATPYYAHNQMWSPRGRPWPRGHVLKSLALVLALKPQVLGLGLEASSPRKLPSPRLEDSTYFELLKFCRSPEKKILEGVFYWRTPEKFF